MCAVPFNKDDYASAFVTHVKCLYNPPLVRTVNDLSKSGYLDIQPEIFFAFRRCYDIQHNDTQHNSSQHNNTQIATLNINDTQHNYTQHSVKQYTNLNTKHNDTRHKTLYIKFMPSVVMLSVIHAECHK